MPPARYVARFSKRRNAWSVFDRSESLRILDAATEEQAVKEAALRNASFARRPTTKGIR